MGKFSSSNMYSINIYMLFLKESIRLCVIRVTSRANKLGIEVRDIWVETVRLWFNKELFDYGTFFN